MLAQGRHSCQDEEGKTGLFLSCARMLLGLLTIGEGDVGKLLELHQGC